MLVFLLHPELAVRAKPPAFPTTSPETTTMKDLRNRSQREREAIAEAILEAYREEEADISIYISQAGAERGRVR